MSKISFIEDAALAGTLYPFTLMRDAADIPLGLLTFREKWSILLGTSAQKNIQFNIRSGILPDLELCKAIRSLQRGQSLFSKDGLWIAATREIRRIPVDPSASDRIFSGSIHPIRYPWELLNDLGRGIELDFSILTKGRKGRSVPRQVSLAGSHPVFIEKGAKVRASYLNTEGGPIYIGADAEVQEGAMIRGPFLLGSHSVVKMGAKIYGPAAAGSGCLLGGEIKRSLLFPFSNKAHEGYMGDSVIGSWCNWGAGTSNSNLKNTAGQVVCEVSGEKISVGKKAGVFMGDHSRTVINSSLNSGTIMGVSVQVGNEGLSPKRVPSFRWVDGKRYRLAEALEHIRNWKALKGRELSSEEISLLKKVFKTDK